MPEFIAIDWETSQLNGLHAEVSSSGVRVQQCFCLSWPTEIDAIAEPQAAGKWFQAELKRLGIRSRQVLVSLPRDATVVRQLDLPDVPDDELPDLVRLQAETKTSSSLDRLVLDYLPLPRSADAASRQVLMVTIAREAIDRIRETIESAGLELVSIGINPASTAELVTRVERRRGGSADETSLTVTRHGRRVEIELLRDRHLLFTHSTQLTGEDDLEDTRLTLAEVRRSLGALSRIDSTVSVTRAWVIGTETENRLLCRSLREELTCDVGIIDPLIDECISSDSAEFPDSHAPFAGPLGMLLATTGPTVESVDFLRPRKPVIRPDRRKLKAGLVAAGVLCVVAICYGGARFHVSGLESQIEKQSQELKGLEEAIKKGRPILKSAGLIDDWEMRNIDWLSRMQQLNEALQGTDRIYLANYKFNPAAGALAAKIEATGFARSRGDVEQLNQRLAERNYRVQTHEISRTSKDADYPFHFLLDLALTSAEAEKPESQ
jgi:hypothetical protein